MRNRAKFSGIHFVDLLNEIALTMPSSHLRNQDKLRLQILLLHLYLDFLMITILEKISPPRNGKKRSFGGRLRLLRKRKTLDSSAFKILHWLNEIRNIIAHEYDFKTRNIEVLIKKMKNKLQSGLIAQFNTANLEGKLSLACVPYINALREHILKKSGNSGTSDNIRIIIENDIVKYAWLGKE